MLDYNCVNWSEHFTYSDGKLFWARSPRNGIKIGDEAGTDNGAGYLRIRLAGKQYMVHKIIYVMNKGSIPDGHVIDHDDNNSLNNHHDNLVARTVSGNNRNRRFKENKSGVKGVYPLEGGYSATIGVNGERIYLGWRKTLQDAIELRRMAEEKYWK